MHTFDDDHEEYAGKSRSRKKRESTAAQKTGERLTALSESQLKNLEVPAALLDAIRDWKKFPGHEAKRRQMQFIGKLMRDMDMEKLQAELDSLLAPCREEKAFLHSVETCRDTLIGLEGTELDAELERLATAYAKAPVAQLKHLAVTARGEKQKKKPPKAYRELFRLLRDVMETSGEAAGS